MNRPGKARDVLIIPRCRAVLRFIEIPSTHPPEIKDIVEYHALKELPYAREEIVAGFRNIGSFRRGYSYIMLAIIKRQQIEEMIALRKAMPDSIRLETELLYLHLLNRGAARRDRVSLIMNIQNDYSEIMIIDGVRPVFSRGFGCGQGALSEEINRSIISYKADRGSKEVEEAVIMHIPGLDKDKIKACLDMFFRIPVNFYEGGLGFGGLAAPLEIDLLPKVYVEKRFSRENARQVFTTCLLLFLLIFTLASFFISKVREKGRIILAFSEKTEKMRKDADQLNAFLEKTRLLDYRKEEGGRAINILKECYRLAPQDISIEGLDYGEKGVLYCKGVSKNSGTVFNFIKALERSEYFRKVEVKYAAKKEIGGREFTDFTIGCFSH